MFQHPVVDAPKGIEARITVVDTGVVNSVVEVNFAGPAFEVALHILRAAVTVIQCQHLLYKALVFFRVGERAGHAFFQLGEKTHHISQRRATVDPDSRAFVVNLTRVAGGAGKPDVILAFIALFDKADRQAVGVEESGFLRQVAVFVDQAIGAKRLVEFGLFQGDKKVVGNQCRALGGVVVPEAVVGAPTLIQVDGGGIVLAKRAVLYRQRTAHRVVVPFLVEFANGKSD